MNKNILLAVLLTLGAAAAPAQVKLKLTDIRALSELSGPATRGSETDGRVDMIINIDSPSVLDEVLRNGGEIVSEVTSGSAIVRIDPAKASSIAGLKGIKGAAVSRLMRLSNHKGREFSHVDEILNGTGLSSAYDGTGVVVGLFDVGLDPNHINFLEDGNSNFLVYEGAKSRVKMWLGYSGVNSTPKVADTPQAIAAITTDSRSESHGTHTAGIMAGSFDTSLGSEKLENYSGIAPGAEIVMAGGPGYNTQILDAVQRIAKYAKEVGKPCVINLSFGDNIGPHDGTDPFTKALNEVAEEYDAVICLSAGNERSEKIAIIKELPEEKPTLLTIAQKGGETPGNYTTSYYQTAGEIEIWTQDDTPFEVTLDVINNNEPDKVLYSFALPENEVSFTETKGFAKTILNYFGEFDPSYKITTDDPDFTEYYSTGMMGGTRGVDPTNSRYYANICMFLNAYQHTVNNTFVRITVKGKPGQKIFLYTDGYYMAVGYRNRPSMWDGPDGNGTNSNMACGTETICVGSYLSNNVSGSGYLSGTVGDISYFSSYGETPDGRIMPDVCAPGQVIVSSRNSYLPTNNYQYPLKYTYSYSDLHNVKKDFYWTTCAGTSMSSPHMAGIAALWRQANPNLTYKEIQEIARTTATEPGFNSKGWGYGRADALAGIKKILGESSVYDIIENAPESIMIESAGGNVYDIFAAAETSVNAAVVNLQGVKVMESAAEGQSLSLDLNGLTPGIYLLHVTAPHSSRTIKIRR